MPVETTGVEYQTVQIGAADLVKGILNRLGVVTTIDQALDYQPEIDTTYGTLAQAVILNRMSFAPQPLYHLSEWVAEHGIDRVLGIQVGWLDDDRVGAMLEAAKFHPGSPQPNHGSAVGYHHIAAPVRLSGRETFLRTYSGSGLVIQCLAHFQETFKRLSACRIQLSLTNRGVSPSAKLTSAANSNVQTLVSLPNSRRLRCNKTFNCSARSCKDRFRSFRSP
jgi:hypothetical protein